MKRFCLLEAVPKATNSLFELTILHCIYERVSCKDVNSPTPEIFQISRRCLG
jgi:hypothetical protein